MKQVRDSEPDKKKYVFVIMCKYIMFVHAQSSNVALRQSSSDRCCSIALLT